MGGVGRVAARSGVAVALVRADSKAAAVPTSLPVLPSDVLTLAQINFRQATPAPSGRLGGPFPGAPRQNRGAAAGNQVAYGLSTLA